MSRTRVIHRISLVVVGVAIAALAASIPAVATAAPVAAGSGTLTDGVTLRLAANATGPSLGSAWLSTGALPTDAVRITLTCAQASWEAGPYPVFPWIPYGAFYASGVTGSETYYITLYDFGPADLGIRDEVRVSTTGGTGPCGAPSGTLPVQSGDFAITP